MVVSSTNWILLRPGEPKIWAMVLTKTFDTGYPDLPEWGFSCPPNERMMEVKLLVSRGFGAGSLLLNWVIELYSEQYDGAVLEVLGGVFNKPALKVYNNFGFQHNAGTVLSLLIRNLQLSRGLDPRCSSLTNSH